MGSIICGEFLEWPTNYYVVTKDLLFGVTYRKMKSIHGIDMILLTVQHPKEVRFTFLEMFGFVFFFLCVNSVSHCYFPLY